MYNVFFSPVSSVVRPERALNYCSAAGKPFVIVIVGSKKTVGTYTPEESKTTF